MTAAVHQAVVANAARTKAEGTDRWADLLKATMPEGLVRDAILASPAWPDIAAVMGQLDARGIDVARILLDARDAGAGVDQAVAAVTTAAANKAPAPAPAIPAPAPARPSATGVGAVFARHLVSIVQEAKTFTEGDGQRVGVMTWDLATAFLAHPIDASARLPPRTRRQLLLRRLDLFIEDNLADPQLSPARHRRTPPHLRAVPAPALRGTQGIGVRDDPQASTGTLFRRSPGSAAGGAARARGGNTLGLHRRRRFQSYVPRCLRRLPAGTPAPCGEAVRMTPGHGLGTAGRTRQPSSGRDGGRGAPAVNRSDGERKAGPLGTCLVPVSRCEEHGDADAPRTEGHPGGGIRCTALAQSRADTSVSDPSDLGGTSRGG